jgi:hypothetical protein
MLTVDKDLARIAELLVAYSGMRLQSDRYKYATSLFVPAYREYERDLEKGALPRRVQRQPRCPESTCILSGRAQIAHGRCSAVRGQTKPFSLG